MSVRSSTLPPASGSASRSVLHRTGAAVSASGSPDTPCSARAPTSSSPSGTAGAGAGGAGQAAASAGAGFAASASGGAPTPSETPAVSADSGSPPPAGAVAGGPPSRRGVELSSSARSPRSARKEATSLRKRSRPREPLSERLFAMRSKVPPNTGCPRGCCPFATVGAGRRPNAAPRGRPTWILGWRSREGVMRDCGWVSRRRGWPSEDASRRPAAPHTPSSRWTSGRLRYRSARSRP